MSSTFAPTTKAPQPIETESTAYRPNRNNKRTFAASANATPVVRRRAKLVAAPLQGDISPLGTPPISPIDGLASEATLSEPTASPRSESPTPSNTEDGGIVSAVPTPPSSAASPGSDRKIWMRACNECGLELHVRRTKCTGCGTVQTSKRALAEAEREAERESARVQKEAAAAETLREEAAAAASQLAKIAKSPRADQTSPAAGRVASTSALALLASADGATAEVADGAALAAPPSSVPRAADPAPEPPATKTTTMAALPPPQASGKREPLVHALARLTPEQRLKLRRLHKLQALLANMPQGVTKPSAAKPLGAAAAVAVTSDEDGAISMLASVACM